MKFIDEVTITVRSGHGGAGAVSFRREKYVPMGGPDGGDGGRGGHVILRVNPNVNTLFHLRHLRHIRAKDGGKGSGKNSSGRGGEDVVVDLPPGTLVYDAQEGALLADLSKIGEETVIAEGGRGGKGNYFFKTNANKAPKFAQPGEDGVELDLRLELKLMADAGLVGFPNAGKSTLISKVSAARPKIADYPFTTLTPNLGVVELDMDRGFVLADIPGLIEGAHEGRGLGTLFLKHVERSRVLCYLLDGSSGDGKEWKERLKVLRNELKSHDPSLLKKKAVVAVNKMDMLDEAQRKAVARWRPGPGWTGVPCLLVSAATGEGLPALMAALHARIAESKKEEAGLEPASSSD